jgi:hypothetical protein
LWTIEFALAEEGGAKIKREEKEREMTYKQGEGLLELRYLFFGKGVGHCE